MHLIRLPTQAFFHNLGLDPPWNTLQNHYDRLIYALSRGRSRLLGSGMTSSAEDVGVHVQYHPEIHIPFPQINIDSCSQVPILKCHECIRAVTQAGPYKRHLREYHQMAYNPDNLYNSLRDTTNGHPVYRYYMNKFPDFYRLRNQINRRIYMLFNPAQDTIMPICDRPELRMHLRYKSILDLLLNQAFMSELAHHCVYCHCAIDARSIRKHYRDCHAQLLTYEPMHKDQVNGLANLGIGRGTCILRNQICNNVQQHQCGILTQLSIMLGQIYDVSHFPIMPTMIRGQSASMIDDPRTMMTPCL